MSLSHRKLSAWYHQLGQQLEAGLPLPAALRSARGTGFPARGLDEMARRIESGGSVEAAFTAGARWLPAADRLVLTAAAEAGRMPVILNRLSERHALVGAVKLRLVLACLYPLLILHVGILLLPLLRMIDWEKGFAWDATAYARAEAALLVPLWVGIALLVFVSRRHGRLIAGPAALLPFVGGFLRAQALSDFAFTLGNFLEAGVRIDRAWQVAGSVAARRDLHAAADAMAPVIARGQRPGVELARWACFPADFVALYQSGEATGRLDQNLLRAAAESQRRAAHALTIATFVYPAVLFLAVAGIVAVHVIKLYVGYLKMIEKMAS